MANELSIILKIDFVKSPLPNKSAGSSTAFSIDVAGDIYKDTNQIISSTNPGAPEAIDFGDINNPGYCFLENLDPTNIIYIQPKSGANTADNMIELNPGEKAIFRVYTSNKTMSAYASAGTPQLRVLIFED